MRDAEGQGPAVGPEQPESAVRSAEYAESAVRGSEVHRSAARGAEYAESAVWGGEAHRSAARGAERPGSAVRERDADGRVVPETGSGAHGRDPAVRDAEGQGPAVGPEQPESAVRSAEYAKSAVRSAEQPESAVRSAEYAESAVWGGEAHRSAVRGAEGAAVAAPGSFDPAVLHDVPLVTYAEDLPIARRYWRHVFGRRLTRTAAVTVPDLRGVLAAVAAGAGFGVLPRYLCQDLLESGALVALLEPEDPPINTGFLVQRPGASDNPDVARVRALLLRAARSW
ncbi:hypothetical protein HKX69_03125 [Streptomyces argyrophyllae]|uniref:LysR substrate-binding domain-containing protein n=1 Tax=Streptomyces argyrophylli TaxID=2726118 RepID=A0A6M4PT21_9ACTN|nr:hypothetical protein HKX69_03125 [Streptomyces argyrophyllae]